MATSEEVKATPSVRQFNWGETVRLRRDANVPGRAGAVAEVCGIVEIQTAEHAKAVVGGSLGKNAYLIEFADGESVEVVGDLLEQHGDSNESVTGRRDHET